MAEYLKTFISQTDLDQRSTGIDFLQYPPIADIPDDFYKFCSLFPRVPTSDPSISLKKDKKDK